MPGRRRDLGAAVSAIVLVVVAGCGGAPAQRATSTSPAADRPSAPTLAASPTAVPTTAVLPTAPPTSTRAGESPSTRPVTTSAGPALPPPGKGAAVAPVIVIDPGHSVNVQSSDPATGLDDSDYENEPEMGDVFAVAQLVRTRLEAAGYQVVLTKDSVTDRVPLGRRAAIANTAHAALAISIHDQAGRSGGIGFDQGNNVVYFQAVGDYRETPTGRRVTFTDTVVATTSRSCGTLFAQQRANAEGHPVDVRGDVGYDLGSRGLAPGNIWIVQLLSDVPWIYNEAGGNTTGMSGLDPADAQRYAAGLVAGVEACVPVAR